jgi:hypothetical protein
VAEVALARDNARVSHPAMDAMEEGPTMEEPDFAHNPDLDQLPPDALADLYEAVREGRINDPDTIRQIAQALAHLALEPPLDADLSYDPAAASDALLQFAARIERHNDSRARGPTGAGGTMGTDLFAPTQDLILPMGPSR